MSHYNDDAFLVDEKNRACLVAAARAFDNCDAKELINIRVGKKKVEWRKLGEAVFNWKLKCNHAGSSSRRRQAGRGAENDVVGPSQSRGNTPGHV